MITKYFFPRTYNRVVLKIRVADPDLNPDPVGSGLFGSPGSGSGKIPDLDPFSTKKDPCNSNFLVI